MNEQKLDALISGLTGSNRDSCEKGKSINRETYVANHISNQCKREILDQREETRFCTIVEVNTLKKMRIIAKREGLLIKDVVDAAFTKAISSYETKHGTITDDNRVRMDDLF